MKKKNLRIKLVNFTAKKFHNLPHLATKENELYVNGFKKSTANLRKQSLNTARTYNIAILNRFKIALMGVDEWIYGVTSKPSQL